MQLYNTYRCSVNVPQIYIPGSKAFFFLLCNLLIYCLEVVRSVCILQSHVLYKCFQFIHTMSALAKIPDVNIDNRGRYKYILVKVVDQNDSSNQSKYVVRGGRAFEYHGKHILIFILFIIERINDFFCDQLLA